MYLEGKISTNHRDIRLRDQFVYTKDQENYSVFTEVTRKKRRKMYGEEKNIYKST